MGVLASSLLRNKYYRCALLAMAHGSDPDPPTTSVLVYRACAWLLVIDLTVLKWVICHKKHIVGFISEYVCIFVTCNIFSELNC